MKEIKNKGNLAVVPNAKPGQSPPPPTEVKMCDSVESGLHDFELVTIDQYGDMVYRLCKRCPVIIGTKLADLPASPS